MCIRDSNGGVWPEYSLSLSGTLSDGDVYVVYNSSSNIDSSISSVGDISWSQASWTGDDAVGLVFQGSLIDVIGEEGADPGNGWDVSGVIDATKDHTLVRKCEVTQGNSDWFLSSGLGGTDVMSSEWFVLPQNDWSDIGQHISPCLSAAVYGCTDSLALNYNSLANTDDGTCISTVYGCMDNTMFNYDPLANTDDNSCVMIVNGCTDATMWNYDILSNTNDGTCMPFIYGCTDFLAMNFDSTANSIDISLSLIHI